MKKHIISLGLILGIFLFSLQLGVAQITVNPKLINQNKLIVPESLKLALSPAPIEKKTLAKMSFSQNIIPSDPNGLDPNKGGIIEANPQERTFEVTTSGQIEVNFSVLRTDGFTHPIKIDIKLVNPLGKTVDSLRQVSVDAASTGRKNFNLKGFANAQTSGCKTANNVWKVVVKRVINLGKFEVIPEISIPTTTSTRNTFPEGGYTLNANAFGDFAFATPKNTAGQIEITVLYTGTAPIEVRLFKPGVEPLANESNASVIKTFTSTSNKFTFVVSANDQTKSSDFWEVRLRNKGTGTQVITNARVNVKFSSCF